MVGVPDLRRCWTRWWIHARPFSRSPAPSSAKSSRKRRSKAFWLRMVLLEFHTKTQRHKRRGERKEDLFAYENGRLDPFACTEKRPLQQEQAFFLNSRRGPE